MKKPDPITKAETLSGRERQRDTIVDETFSKPTVVVEGQRGRLVNGTLIDNRYSVEKFLREGGLSTIYAGIDKKMVRAVALKVMQPLDDRSEAAKAQIRALLEEESRIIARIKKDEHIVECFDSGVTEDGRPYLVLELLLGTDLEHYLREHKQMPVGKALQTILPAAWALSSAHEASVLHRDVKPGNIFLVSTRGGVVVKLIDFNVSKRTLTGTARTGLGTDYYMAPELAQMRPASEMSDLWALAAVLVECLAGQRYKDLRASAPNTPIVELLQGVLPPLPHGMLDVIARALSPEPEDRWPSVHAFGLALLPFAEANTKMRWTEKFTAAPSELPSGLTAALHRVEHEQRPRPPTFAPQADPVPSSSSPRLRALPMVLGAFLVLVIGLGALLLRKTSAPVPQAPDTVPSSVLGPPPVPAPAPPPAPAPAPPSSQERPAAPPAPATASQPSLPEATEHQHRPKRRRKPPAASTPTVDENGIPLLAP